MIKETAPVTIAKIVEVHRERRKEIVSRLAEFQKVGKAAPDPVLWEEMVYCFFTAGCSARMGINAVDAVRPLLMHGSQSELATALSGVHRYPNARARYISHTRQFLNEKLGLKLREKLLSFTDAHSRRDWLVREKGIKGLGYKEASHFLRNVGFKGYGILDKHILRCLADLKIIEEPKPPNTRTKYLTIEEKLRDLTKLTGIDFDELDLVLWSMKTGIILK